MPLFDVRTSRVLFTILVFALGLLFIALAWRTLLTFLFAILFAYLFEPTVTAMQARLRMGRARAVALLYAVLIVGVGAFFFFVGPTIVQQAGRLSQLAPQLSARVASGRIAREVGSERGWSYQTQERIQQFMQNHREQIAAWEQQLLNELGSLASQSWWVALVPIIAIFFLIGGGRFSEALVEQLDRRRQRVFLGALFRDIHDVLASYIRAQILLTLLATAVYLVAFELMRLHYAIALGVVAGLLEFIPMIGPLLGAAVVLATAFFTNYPYLLLVAVFLGVWRLVQDYYNSPHIMGGQVQLHPLAVLFGVLAGAEIGGVIGVYLSVPVMATLRVLWVRWRDFQSAQMVMPPTGEPSRIIPPAGAGPRG